MTEHTCSIVVILGTSFQHTTLLSKIPNTRRTMVIAKAARSPWTTVIRSANVWPSLPTLFWPSPNVESCLDSANLATPYRHLWRLSAPVSLVGPELIIVCEFVADPAVGALYKIGICCPSRISEFFLTPYSFWLGHKKRMVDLSRNPTFPAPELEEKAYTLLNQWLHGKWWCRRRGWWRGIQALTGLQAASAGNCLHNRPLVVLHRAQCHRGESIVECFRESASSKGGMTAVLKLSCLSLWRRLLLLRSAC